MIRTVLAVTIFAFGATAVLAQNDPIAARKALMKTNGGAAGQGAKFMKGEEPFDLDQGAGDLCHLPGRGRQGAGIVPG